VGELEELFGETYGLLEELLKDLLGWYESFLSWLIIDWFNPPVRVPTSPFMLLRAHSCIR
jgi:hypothetical protein